VCKLHEVLQRAAGLLPPGGPWEKKSFFNDDLSPRYADIGRAPSSALEQHLRFMAPERRRELHHKLERYRADATQSAAAASLGFEADRQRGRALSALAKVGAASRRTSDALVKEALRLSPSQLVDAVDLPAGDRPADDQKRVVTVEQALRNGADYIVVGRPIRQAAEPRAAAEAIQATIATIFPA